MTTFETNKEFIFLHVPKNDGLRPNKFNRTDTLYQENGMIICGKTVKFNIESNYFEDECT